MSELPDDNSDDQVIPVLLPRKDYLRLRQMIADQEVQDGMKTFGKRWGGIILATLAGLASLFGLIQFFKDYH